MRSAEQLIEIWAEVFKLNRIGIHYDIFALGGRFLLVTQVASHLRTRLEVPLHSFFETSAMTQFAGIITRLNAQGYTHHSPTMGRRLREAYRIQVTSLPLVEDSTGSRNQ